MKFTPSQKLASELTGNSLTVSAAAGSGKNRGSGCPRCLTAVRQREAMQCRPAFKPHLYKRRTAQMRRRIAGALRDKLSENPDSDYIRRQLLLLPAAKICTIHAACFDLIRQNFDKLGLDPRFSIAEETRLELMRSELTDDLSKTCMNARKTTKMHKPS